MTLTPAQIEMVCEWIEALHAEGELTPSLKEEEIFSEEGKALAEELFESVDRRSPWVQWKVPLERLEEVLRGGIYH